MEHWLWILLAAPLAGQKQVSRRRQCGSPAHLNATEGHSVKLSCKYQTSTTTYTLFWYKQDGNNQPIFIQPHTDKLDSSEKPKSTTLTVTAPILSQAAKNCITALDVFLKGDICDGENVLTTPSLCSSGWWESKSRYFKTSALCSSTLAVRRAGVRSTSVPLSVDHQLLYPVDFNLVVAMEHWLWILLAALLTGQEAECQLSPLEDRVSGREGENVTLKCRFKTRYDYAYFEWYKQPSDLQAPQFILGKGAGEWNRSENIPDKRFDSRASLTETELIIRSLSLADTALYYCAYRHTVK
ncbi:uncharacterized protein LOC142884310 [Nelusetta ayraudi]|uniref:uncharacterized protein LOC142884310 n=1 Tax=Nelusetta ayraudi TaxID=303726 RepID=UPI003F7205F4